MLIAKHLRFVKNKKALLDIDHFKFSSGQFHSIVGPNGAGKSTLLKALIGDIGAAQSVRELHHISLILRDSSRIYHNIPSLVFHSAHAKWLSLDLHHMLFPERNAIK